MRLEFGICVAVGLVAFVLVYQVGQFSKEACIDTLLQAEGFVNECLFVLWRSCGSCAQRQTEKGLHLSFPTAAALA